MNKNKKKVIVLGLGVSGISAIRFLSSKKNAVICFDDNINSIKKHSDQKELVERGVVFTDSLESVDFSDLSFIVVSPGIPSSHPMLLKARSEGIKVIGEIELAFQYLNGQRCVGVTGTNGKTTVTMLIEHMLKGCGINARAVGNIGIPLTSQLLDAKEDVFIIELSSYQLESAMTPCLDCAIILNITPDHLDRHFTMDSYIEAKHRIANLLCPGGVCIVNEYVPIPKCNQNIATYGFSKSNDFYTDGYYFYVDKKKLGKNSVEYLGKNTHHLENILAAYSVCVKLGVSSQDVIDVVCSFKRPPHRIEFVRNVDKIAYYNDSKGTNVDAVVRAVDSMDNHVILIAGGVDKGGNYNLWKKKFPGKVKYVFAIGAAAKKIQNELNETVPVEIVCDLDAAVKCATNTSQPGDTVLLSPGCSSYDMFENFEHRGNEFKQIVNAIIGKEKREYEPT